MFIQINDDFRIRSDVYNIILEQRSIIKKTKVVGNIGNEIWSAIGFYPTVETALNGCLNMKIRLDDSEGIHLLLETIKEVRKDIQSLKITFEKDGQAEEIDNEQDHECTGELPY